MKKERVDVLLVQRGLLETREKAKRAIMAGLVFSGTERMDKPGMKVDADIPLQVKGDPLPYVSRGGLKLKKALSLFPISFKNKIGIDIGASTGGFTDCALQNGAKRMYALDVGYNQLDWKLRQDERVVTMERTNFRYVTSDQFSKGVPQFATIDVSFISLTLILPVLKKILMKNGDVIALVKPQFEAGREQVGKRGVVRDRHVHIEVLTNICEFAINEGYDVCGLGFSPITGNEGNIEFLLHLRLRSDDERGRILTTKTIDETVTNAHNELITKLT